MKIQNGFENWNLCPEWCEKDGEIKVWVLLFWTLIFDPFFESWRSYDMIILRPVSKFYIILGNSWNNFSSLQVWRKSEKNPSISENTGFTNLSSSGKQVSKLTYFSFISFWVWIRSQVCNLLEGFSNTSGIPIMKYFQKVPFKRWQLYLSLQRGNARLKSPFLRATA